MHAAYNPRMFQPRSAGEPPHMVLATGAQDQRVAIWHEGYVRPRVVGTRLFRSPLLVISLCVSASTSSQGYRLGGAHAESMDHHRLPKKYLHSPGCNGILPLIRHHLVCWCQTITQFTVLPMTTTLLCTFCRHAVSDMAWTPDGMTILACSGDGTIALLMFSEKELGKPLSQVHIWHNSFCCPGCW